MTIRNDLMTAVSLAALASAGAISAAQAADLSEPAVVVAQSEEMASADWSGFYAGFGLSSAFGVDTLSLIHTDEVKTDATNDYDLSGVNGFVEGGYDFQAGSLVFGVNGNYDFNFSDDVSTSTSKSGKAVTSESLGNGWGVGVRAGVLANESTLVFGSLGYASRDVEVGYEKEGKDPFSETYAATGYYVGAGIETLLTDSISLKAEYRYSQFGDGYESAALGKSGKHVLSSDGFDTQQVRASLNWRF